MNRRRVLLMATLITILVVVLPFLLIAQYARDRAMELERQHLNEYGNWTLQRAERNLELARGVLRTLEHENWQSCSPEQIARMRELTIDTDSVDEIGYFENNKLACTSWGDVDKNVVRRAPDTMLADNYGLYLHILPIVSHGTVFLGISHGNYNVLMKPEHLVDVLTDTKMTLGVTTLDGRLVASNEQTNEHEIQAVAHDPGSGIYDTRMYATVQNADLRALAITDGSAADDRIDAELLLLIPLGVATSAILVGLVIWVSRQRLSPQTELQLAIKRKEFIVHYQPIIDLVTGRCVGAEALVRWQRTNKTVMTPDLFIPLAEQTGLIESITELVIERVVIDLAETLRQHRSIHIAINVSARDMQTGRFLPHLACALSDADIDPSQIWLEATETGFMEVTAAQATIEKARRAGHQVAIDDFGTGYSSLSMLETLPVDALKIDKSFVEAIGTQAATSVVVPYMIDMAHGLRLQIVAEGIETQEQEAYLRRAGVEFGQGWLYAKALPADMFMQFHEKRNAREDSESTEPMPHA